MALMIHMIYKENKATCISIEKIHRKLANHVHTYIVAYNMHTYLSSSLAKGFLNSVHFAPHNLWGAK